MRNSTTTVTVSVGADPSSIAVNPVTNKIYVANIASNNVTMIDGATNSTITVSGGTNPGSLAVNPVTNKIYVTNQDSNFITVIDGASNSTTTVGVGGWVTVNPVTNKIYVVGESVNVIDGATNSIAMLSTPTNPIVAAAIAVNPVTNQIYVANSGADTVTVITEQQVQTIPLTTTITPLPGDRATSPTPTFTFNVQSTFSPNPTTPASVFFQVDTWQGAWTAATGAGSLFNGTLLHRHDAPTTAGLPHSLR